MLHGSPTCRHAHAAHCSVYVSQLNATRRLSKHPQYNVLYAAGSERAAEQDGQHVLHLDLRQHAQAGASVVLRLLALRPKGQLQLQSCTWTPASPPDGAVSGAPSAGDAPQTQHRELATDDIMTWSVYGAQDPATLAAAAAVTLPQTASAQGAAQGVSQQEQLRGMVKQQMGQQPGLHAAFQGNSSSGTAARPSLNAAATSGAQPAGTGGMAALAALLGTAGACAPGMQGSSPQHLGSSPPHSSSAPGGAAESDVAAATRGPAGGVHTC